MAGARRSRRPRARRLPASASVSRPDGRQPFERASACNASAGALGQEHHRLQRLVDDILRIVTEGKCRLERNHVPTAEWREPPCHVLADGDRVLGRRERLSRPAFGDEHPRVHRLEVREILRFLRSTSGRIASSRRLASSSSPRAASMGTTLPAGRRPFAPRLGLRRMVVGHDSVPFAERRANAADPVVEEALWSRSPTFRASSRPLRASSRASRSRFRMATNDVELMYARIAALGQVVRQRHLERVTHQQPGLFGPPPRREDEALCVQAVREHLRQLERLRDLERKLVARHRLVVAAA